MPAIEKVIELDQLRQVALNYSQIELGELLEASLKTLVVALTNSMKMGTFEGSGLLLEFANQTSTLFFKISSLAEERGINFYVLDMERLREFTQRSPSTVTHAEAAFNLIGYKIMMLYFELLGDTAQLKLGSDRFDSTAFNREL